ncbi:hypothetical protein GCK72_007880 [Caenorhabditis remanei]|uniref:DUF38 domain-containing protein n=1 Tax=Caenorhabditis remanei TaxID=31234 RepID=A0A6A5HID5_CAERE|nr:hypothetical protein GCK72_007880 [Caenorhabditis remanei]KAF1767920.1 hypothetical protein GCK72_007880 [Caenorhabditis remanei]
MHLPLSYPGLGCVLEHLEAVKRAHIIARAPGLQKIDKLIPLCLKNLFIDSDEMTINKLLIEYDKDVLAETLILHVFTHRIVSVEDLKKLNNKTVVFEYCISSRVDIIPLIKYFVETKKDIGTTFVIATDGKYFLSEMLREFEQEFGEFRCDLDGVNERLIPGLPKFSIPINNESRIQVYAIEDPEEDGRWKIVIKPVSDILGL